MFSKFFRRVRAALSAAVGFLLRSDAFRFPPS
jgi:hypothetical protein